MGKSNLAAGCACLFLTFATGCDDAPATELARGRVAHHPTSFRLEFDLQIGSLDGANDVFTRVEALLPRADGSVVVLEPTAGGALEFDEEGRFVRQMGRIGSGPAEFQFPLHLGWWGKEGAIWISDPIISRLTVFSATGDLVHSRAVSLGGRKTDMESGSEFITYRVMEDSVVVGVSEITPWGVPNSPVTVAPASDGVGQPLTIVELERSESSIPIPILTQGGGGVMEDPLPDGPMLRFSPDGQFAFTVSRTNPVSNDSALVVATAIDVNGAIGWRRHLWVSPVDVPSQVRDSILTFWEDEVQDFPYFGEVSPQQSASAVEQMLDLPRFYPPVIAAVPTGENGLWLAIPADDRTARVHILDDTGSEEGVLEIELALARTLAAATGSYAWAISEGPFGIPVVKRFRIVQGVGPGLPEPTL